MVSYFLTINILKILKFNLKIPKIFILKNNLKIKMEMINKKNKILRILSKNTIVKIKIFKNIFLKQQLLKMLLVKIAFLIYV